MLCHLAWCPSCYIYDYKVKFHVAVLQDRDGNVWRLKEDDKYRFLHARSGDNLMTPFQCDVCVFRTITGRSPTLSEQDKFLLTGI